MPRKMSRVFQNVSHSNNELTHEIGTTCDAVVSQADANVRILKGVGEGGTDRGHRPLPLVYSETLFADKP